MTFVLRTAVGSVLNAQVCDEVDANVNGSATSFLAITVRACNADLGSLYAKVNYFHDEAAIYYGLLR